jgi:hypothetical protein
MNLAPQIGPTNSAGLSSGNGFVQALNNTQVDQQMRGSSQAPVDMNSQLISGLCGYVETCWSAAKMAKVEIEGEMVEAVFRRAGKYTPAKEAQIKADGQPLVYMNLVGNKCRAAEGWLMDIALPNGERPFSINPSPVPEIPPNIKQRIQDQLLQQMQQAVMGGAVIDVSQMPQLQEDMERKLKQQLKQDSVIRANGMEDQIDDLATEGGWYAAVEDCIPSLVTHHNCFLKGPIITKKKVLTYSLTPNSKGVYKPTVEEKLIPTFYAVDPLNMYPSASARNVQDGHLIEKIPLRAGTIFNCIGVPGYDEARIRAALSEYKDGHDEQTNVDSALRIIDKKTTEMGSPDRNIDVLEFHGAVLGSMLSDWGHKGVDPNASYEIQAWKIGRFVVRAVINDHPTGRRPYESASYDKRPGTFWGWGGVPQTIRDVADICNAAARSIVFNMAVSSGPQVMVNIERLAEGETITELKPWKVWQTKDPRSPQSTQKAIDFFVPPNVADVLKNVYEYFSMKADEYSGIPSYATGIPTSQGAAGTASGMSMLMGQATRQMKRVVSNMDRMTEGSIDALHLHEMLYGTDDTIKGDSFVRARGAGALMVREQNQMRLNEALQITANPIDMGIIKAEGRAELLRALIKNFDIPVDNVVPDRADIIAQAKAAMMQEMQPPPQGPGAPGQQPAARNMSQPAGPGGSPMGGQGANTVSQ